METKTLTISKIGRFTTKKDGSPLLTKAGKAYTSVRIQTNEYGDRWLSGFGNQLNANWKEGDKVEVIVEEKGEYLNFTTPKAEDKFDAKLEHILSKLAVMSLKLDAIHALLPQKPKPAEEDPHTAFDDEGEFPDTEMEF